MGQVKYVVLERHGQIRVVPSRPDLDGVVPVAHRDRDGVGAAALAQRHLARFHGASMTLQTGRVAMCSATENPAICGAFFVWAVLGSNQ